MRPRRATDTQRTNIPLGIFEKRPEPDVFMTPEHQAMIVKNVRRGMGLVAMHCAIWNPKSRQDLDAPGAEKPGAHTGAGC